MLAQLQISVVFFLVCHQVRTDGIQNHGVDVEVIVQKALGRIESRLNDSLDALVWENKQLKDRVAHLETHQDVQKSDVFFSVRFREGKVFNVLDHHTLKFDYIISNVGNGFHTESGSFCAPVSGYYMLFISVYPLYDRFQVCLSVNNTDVFCAAGNNISEQGSNMAFIHLQEGVCAQVKKLWGNSNTLYGTHWTTFSGFLVSRHNLADSEGKTIVSEMLGRREIYELENPDSASA